METIGEVGQDGLREGERAKNLLNQGALKILENVSSSIIVQVLMSMMTLVCDKLSASKYDQNTMYDPKILNNNSNQASKNQMISIISRCLCKLLKIIDKIASSLDYSMVLTHVSTFQNKQGDKNDSWAVTTQKMMKTILTELVKVVGTKIWAAYEQANLYGDKQVKGFLQQIMDREKYTPQSVVAKFLQEYRLHHMHSEQRTALISQMKERCRDLSFLCTFRKSLESVPEDIRMEIELELVRTSVPTLSIITSDSLPNPLTPIGALKEIHTNVCSNNVNQGQGQGQDNNVQTSSKHKTYDQGGKHSDRELSTSKVEKLKLKQLNQDGSNLENKFKNQWYNSEDEDTCESDKLKQIKERFNKLKE